MSVLRLSPDQPWYPPNGFPDKLDIEDYLEYLIGFLGKGLVERGSIDQMRKGLEEIISRISLPRFNQLDSFGSNMVTDSKSIFRLLAGSNERGDEIHDVFTYNTAQSADDRYNGGYELEIEPLIFTQISVQTIWARAFCPDIGIGVGLLWSPSVDALRAAKMKKHIGVEAAYFPVYLWRLDHLYLGKDDQSPEFDPEMFQWHSTLKKAMEAFDMIHRADDSTASEQSTDGT